MQASVSIRPHAPDDADACMAVWSRAAKRVFERNERARGFYAAMGFRETARRIDPQTGHLLIRVDRRPVSGS